MQRSKRVFQASLQLRSLVVLVLLIIVAVTGTTYMCLAEMEKEYLQAVTWRAEVLMRDLNSEIRLRDVQPVEGRLPKDTFLSMYQRCQELYEAGRLQNVSFVCILDPMATIAIHNERSLWQTRFTGLNKDSFKRMQDPQTVRIHDMYHTLIPVRNHKDVLLAVIDVGFPREIVLQKRMDNMKHAVILMIALFAAAFPLVWFWIRPLLIQPLTVVSALVSDMTEGQLHLEIVPVHTAEFRDLLHNLIRMRDSLGSSLDELEQKNREMMALMACSPVALFCVDMLGNVTLWPDSASKLFGWCRNEVLGRPMPTVPPEKKEKFAELCASAWQGSILVGRHVEQYCKDGSLKHVSFSSAPVQDHQGKIIGMMGAMQDITEHIAQEKAHHEMKEQLFQAQKMESVGRLAGGVAHDYNNMLSVILGYAEIMREQLVEHDDTRQGLDEIIHAAKRSAEITKQLLAFARKQAILPQVISLNESVQNMLKMIKRLIGEQYEVTWIPQDNLPFVKMDVTQIDSILVNLCINAKDAMEQGGKITIETQAVTVDAAYCETHWGVTTGNFVCLIISDNGKGMSKEIKKMIFEPFFTTKKPGQGTGLGLATVYGIVKQNNGFINVYSEPGQGATFKIYLPVCGGDAAEKEGTLVQSDYTGHGERILVVEDEEAILKVCKSILIGLNYEVVATQNPFDAVSLAQESGVPFAILLTDLVLPGMTGTELSERLTALFPQIVTLYMSGYTANAIARNGIIGEELFFLQKPFSKNELALKVQKALGTQHT